MTIEDESHLESALSDAGLAWLVRYWGDEKAKFLQETAQKISDFVEEFALRYKERPDPFRLLQENAVKGRAFFQFDTLVASVEMKIMVWRILQGCDVTRVEFHYDRDSKPSLEVELRTPYGERENYASDYWADFRVLRHFGTVKTGDTLRLEGYYAVK
jgi:hypothetical protein